jgi:hypothetical protein
MSSGLKMLIEIALTLCVPFRHLQYAEQQDGTHYLALVGNSFDYRQCCEEAEYRFRPDGRPRLGNAKPATHALASEVHDKRRHSL